MIVACRLSNNLDIGGFVLRGNYVGVSHTAAAAGDPGNGASNSLAASAPGRERIAGFEITRNVPDDVWERWEARGMYEATGVVHGSNDETELAEWCWRNVRSHGHAHGAPRGDAGSTVPGPPPVR